MDMQGRYRPRFNPFEQGFVHLQLGQSSLPALEDLERRSQEAVARYNALIRRVAGIQDDTLRTEILGWIGDGSIPGSPSDRFRHVKGEVDQGAPWDEMRTGHLDDLEEANAELETRVVDAEKSGVIDGTGPLAIVDRQGKLTDVGTGLVVVAASALFVVTLVFK